MSRIRISGGRVIDPARDIDAVGDVLIEDGKIVEKLTGDGTVEEVDAGGFLVVPGLIDMHVHLREPGREDEETVESGARAAAAGGFTTIVCMPNTDPPIDCRSVVDYVKERATQALVNVKIVGAVTRGTAGETLADMGEMAGAGVVAFSDDGRPVMSSALMRRALEYAQRFGRPIISHAEDLQLSDKGVMHEGWQSTSLGLLGIPAAAEEIMVARDIALVRLTGGRLHVAHVSTAAAIAHIRAAKLEGLPVTCEVTPHHLVLTDESLAGYDSNYKVNPPLRSEVDRAALREALIDRTVDVIASDHAPHATHEKELELELAPPGMIGLETTVPLLLSMVADDRLSVPMLIDKLTAGPAAVLGLEGGTLAPGTPADVTVIDPKAEVELNAHDLQSNSINSPFIGQTFAGGVPHVLRAGRWIKKDGRLVT